MLAFRACVCAHVHACVGLCMCVHMGACVHVYGGFGGVK